MMATRLHQDQDHKNETLLRALSKLPPNRTCINCNSQATHYVCTTFATFICITCSGIHREFTHRVKSISMAKFTPQEITALQQGGNQRAKGIYFKSWDFERQTLPDSSNIDKLRDFIKHIYVDQRFAGEKNADKPPAVKVDRENSDQEKSFGPTYNVKESSSRDKAVTVNGTRNNSSDSQQEGIATTSRVVKEEPVAVPPARILQPPKTDAPSTPRTPTPVAPVQSTKNESNIKDASTQKPPEVKLVSSISLIDFDSDPEPVLNQKTPPTSNQNRDIGWASFDTWRHPFVGAPASSATNLETSKVHQSAPGPVPGTAHPKMLVQNHAAHQNNVSVFPTVQRENHQFDGPSSMRPAIESWNHTVAPNFHTNIAAPNYPSLARGPQQSMNGPGALPMGVTLHQSTASPTVPSDGRRALPEDLFTMSYAPRPASVPGWHSGAHIQMVYTMQYPNQSPAQFFTHPVQFMNPLDFGSASKAAHVSTFPSMSSMQGALPNLKPDTGNPNAFSHANSIDSFGAQWAPQPYQLSYPQASRPSQYLPQPHTNNMVQQIPNSTHYSGNQNLGGYGTVNGGYAFSGMNSQQLSFRNPQSGNSSLSHSVGGNPFA